MFAKSLILSALAAIAVAAPTPAGAPHPKRSTDTYGNMATWYDAETGNAGACGNYLSNDDRFVAVAMNSPIPCGTWLGFNVNGKTSYGYVADKCASCADNHYDMSKTLFNDFDGFGQGVINDIWSWHIDDWINPTNLLSAL